MSCKKGCHCHRCKPAPSDTDCGEAVERSSFLLGKDDNCENVTITPDDGVVVSDGDGFFITDGSEERGVLKLDLPETGATDSIIGQGNDGAISKLPAGSDGQVLTSEDGQWKPKDLNISQTQFTQDQIGEEKQGVPVVFGCAAGGKIKLTTMSRCLDDLGNFQESIIWMGTDGMGRCMTIDEFIQRIIPFFCQFLPIHDPNECAAYVLGCSANGLIKIPAQGGKVLVGTASGNAVCWGYDNKDPIDSSAMLQVFDYKGADQISVVPDNANRVEGYLWGAGGSRDFTNNVNQGQPGVGGYTNFVISVTPGGRLTVVVGQGKNGAPNEAIYGFGGIASSDGHNHSGGGLTGVFMGDTLVTATDYGRAIAIAGGGGAAGATGPNQNLRTGWPGNGWNTPQLVDIWDNIPWGLTPTMQGANATPGIWGTGGGGGGYRGGTGRPLSGWGGSGYVSPAASVSNILHANFADTVPPATNNQYYSAGIGTGANPGRAVLRYFKV